MKTIVLKTFKDLVTVFPTLTFHQIINLYYSVLDELEFVEFLIEYGTDKYTKEELQAKREDCHKADAFLSSYLARVCCRQNGFDRRK